MTPVVERPGKPGTPWTVEELLEWYRLAKAKLGRPPKYDEARPYNATIDRLVGSFDELVALAGDDPRGKGKRAKEDDDG